jgi:uncharacterized OsmC-like protein
MTDAQHTTYSVDARLLGAGRAEAEAKRATIAFDAAPAGGDELPGPAELLATAFAACLLKNVERFSAMLPFTQSGARVHVTATRQSSPPRFIAIDYELRVVTHEPDDRLDLLHRNLRRHGTVYNTLAAVCEVNGTIIADRPAAG